MTKDISNAIFIIDGSSFLYRAYYSIKPLHTDSGMPVQAVYGFCRMIKKLIDNYNPQKLIVAWDSPGKTVRHDIYEYYKDGRQAPPSDLFAQKKIIEQFADAISVVQISMTGVEADDLMYSIAQDLSLDKQLCVFVTSDKDMGQALNEYIVMFDPFKDIVITKESLEEKLGFNLDRLPMYYALIGDSSDNIPGARGIGPKGAQKLVQQFKSLQDLYENIENSGSARIQMLLKESKDNVFLSYQLFVLRYYETYITQKCCDFSKSNWDNAQPLFQELGFKSLFKSSSGKQEKKEVAYLAQTQRYSFVLVNTPELLHNVIDEIKTYKKCALDTEGDCIPALQTNVVGISVCTHEGLAYYIPFGHHVDEKQLSKDMVVQHLKPILENENIEKYLHNAKYDILTLSTLGIELKGVVFDTMIAASLLVLEGQRVGLKSLSEYYFGERMFKFSEVLKTHKCANFAYVPLGLATEYAAVDAHQTLKLYNKFKDDLEKEGLLEPFYAIEMPLVDVLVKMEKQGIYINQKVLDDINVKVSRELEGLYHEILDLIGHTHQNINLNSSRQLAELLFVYLQLPAVKKTAQKTGYSTDNEVLKVLAKIHPVPALIIKYRELYKLKSTYIEGLSKSVNSRTQKIHTSLSQTAVATGRLSSSDPNLQNIPVESFNIRSAFIAPENNVFLSADYSQIELRVLAYLSQDANLLHAFKNNQDIHALTAAGLFEVSLDKVTYEQRQIGKRINFSILYGLTAHGLSKDLEITHKTAQAYIDKYMEQYPGVCAWMECVVEQTKEKGYVETLWGRRRGLPGIYEKNKTLFQLARRAAINTVAQGTAAELVKLSMIKLDKLLKEHNYKASLILQIHDELLLQVPQEEAYQVEILVKDTLQNIVSWNVPLVVTTRIGKNWQEVTK